ncbi:UvrD-helicase domain-containing protein [Saccharophagus degradans]|uniref:DNA 3'-5' helicase n=1 Tax=Saccharophagus degradans (strain 2-40 / ATCC 43961 / DSM 17024) TaxID=203122 RepID=Q21PC0_SACD2|nr:ATP-dependent helicase [Saccharophagus degradans]ABD79459.1 UvrD/REP helicase [Saccharophagus degradans 2-40]
MVTRINPCEWKPQGVDDLEPNAWEGLRENKQHAAVLAGAGAGKTEFLAQKAAYLLQTGICSDPNRILAISFKNDAARVLKERVNLRCAPEQSRRFESFTYDGFTKFLLDRFRLAIPEPYAPPPDYNIYFPNKGTFQEFLNNQKIRGVNVYQLQKDIANLPLPAGQHNYLALKSYWQCRLTSDEVALSFQMINRLIEYLIRSNPNIKHALRSTYPFVFLDEFQDTTSPQYELLKFIFLESNSLITAVGDDKQQIMGWAGALPEAFNVFNQDFGAKNFDLVSNWRSHPELVSMQHAIAQMITPGLTQPEAKNTKNMKGDVAAIWGYSDRNDEIQGVSNWISEQINSGTKAHELAILVRTHADKLEVEIAPHLLNKGISIRNVARIVDGIAIQDILTEKLTTIILPFLYLGVLERSPENWNRALISLCALEGVDFVDERAHSQQQDRLQYFSRLLRQDLSNGNFHKGRINPTISSILAFLTEDAIRSSISEYKQDRDYNRVLNGIVSLLEECADCSSSWLEALDRFQGVDQVPLMTIHKSKGLEFQTIIFFGLDAKTWWSLTPDNPEELRSFFVAFTRAKQSTFFTSCSQTGNPVTWIEEILTSVGVNKLAGPGCEN